jgi:NitT/TauT family transport system substrate-binding protein
MAKSNINIKQCLVQTVSTVVVLVTVVTAFALGARNASAANRLDHVTLGLPIPPTIPQAFYAFGKDLGIFKNENINLKITVLKGSGDVIPQVASKHILIGWSIPDTVIASFADNRPLPVTFFYNALPRNSMQLGVLDKSSIHKITDLRGKSVGVGALTWGTIPRLEVLLKKAGLVPGKDVHIAAVGILGPGFHALESGEVAALNYNASWFDLAKLEGTRTRLLHLPPISLHMITEAYVANSEELKKHRDLFARFGRAITKARLACDANLAACVRAFWRRHPAQKKRNLHDAVWLLKRQLNRILPYETHAGHFDFAQIKKYIDAFRETGVIHGNNVPIKKIFSNRLVPEFSKFNHKHVLRKAREYEYNNK